MNTDLKLALTHLARGKLLQLRNGRGKGVAVFDGHVWVTQDSDPEDHVLGTGESFAFDRPGLAIVQALSDASLLVFDVDTRSGPERRAPRPAAAAMVESLERPATCPGDRDAIARGFSALGRLWLRLDRVESRGTRRRSMDTNDSGQGLRMTGSMECPWPEGTACCRLSIRVRC